VERRSRAANFLERARDANHRLDSVLRVFDSCDRLIVRHSRPGDRQPDRFFEFYRETDAGLRDRVRDEFVVIGFAFDDRADHHDSIDFFSRQQRLHDWTHVVNAWHANHARDFDPKRLGMTVTLAERERQLVVARDEENMWMVTDHQGESRAAYDGALDVDVVFSPFFNALPIRRVGLNERADSVTVPTIYVRLPEMSVTSAVVSYSSSAAGAGEGIKVHSPVSDVTLTVDADGFIVNYPDLAERI